MLEILIIEKDNEVTVKITDNSNHKIVIFENHEYQEMRANGFNAMTMIGFVLKVVKNGFDAISGEG